MTCSQCGSEVLVPASFCPSCGAQLHSESSGPPNFDADSHRVNASDIVLMFGDRFAEVRDEGYKVPCSHVEVGVSSLVIASVTAALAALAEEGFVSLTRGQKKGFLFKSDAAIIRKEQAPALPRAGLEGKILACLTGDMQKDDVRGVIRRVLGQSTMDPYTVILSQIMEHAHQTGFFVEDEKAPPIVKFLAGKTVATPLSPVCNRIATVTDEVPRVQALLEGFQAANPELYALIGKDVKKSIESAYIQT